MKIDRFRRQALSAWGVKRMAEFHRIIRIAPTTVITLAAVVLCEHVAAEGLRAEAVVASSASGHGLPVANRPETDPTASHPTASDPTASRSKIVDDAQGRAVLRQVLNRLTQGPAFNAKLRQRVWTSGREAVGIGTYEQAGESTGNYNLQVTMHDGVGGQHTMQQISDGRLAWTRTDIADSVLLRRVDIRILEQRVREAGVTSDLPPRVLVGGLTELIDSIGRDYNLRLKPGAFQLKANPVRAATVKLGEPAMNAEPEKFLVVAGTLKPDVREQILLESGRTDWPSLCPSHVQVLITTQPDPATHFGEGLPRRIYFFSDPLPNETTGNGDPDGGVSAEPISTSAAESAETGPLISLIELYSVQPITAPPKERFTFDSRDDDNNYINETQRYLQRYGL